MPREFNMFTFLLLAILTTFVSSYKPIIGIYGNANPESNLDKLDSDFVDGEYVRWFENMGAEVVAIHGWYSEDELEELLSKINGVLFQGGDRDLTRNKTWEQSANFVINYCKDNKIPLWGTCQGFQLIGFLLSGNDDLLKEVYEDDWGTIHPSTLEVETGSTVLFKHFTEDDAEIYNTKNSTIYFHRHGISREGFKNLSHVLKITSTGKAKGKEYVASYEGVNNSIKIYGTQYHLEKIYYMREKEGENLEANIDCFAISYKILYAFMEEVYANENTMDEEDREKYNFVDDYEMKEGKDLKVNFRQYFDKEKKDNKKTMTIVIVVLIVVIVIFLGVVILLSAKAKDETKDDNLEKIDV